MRQQTKNRYACYENIHRTTFDQVFESQLPHVGIYILAYMGKVLYIGKAESSVVERLENHIKQYTSRIGYWLRTMEFDWANVRLDIVEPPPRQDRLWFSWVENACIKRFIPLFNEQLIPESRSDYEKETRKRQTPSLPLLSRH